MLSLFSKSKKKVLIIDDDREMLKNYDLIFSNEKEFEVVTVSSQKEFKKHIQSASAVVSDLHMVTETGLSFKDVKSTCESAKIPLLLLTGDIMTFYKNQMSKPVKASSLRTKILEMLGGAAKNAA